MLELASNEKLSLITDMRCSVYVHHDSLVHQKEEVQEEGEEEVGGQRKGGVVRAFIGTIQNIY